ncbi:PSMD8 ATPase, partial [Picathartes gymnocephalus]|nr:PSMD8 ATPase [Picathartes gymnocephalus]
HFWGAVPHFRPQYLMEGSYNKVFLAKGNIPAESYTFFIDILLDTIRSGTPKTPKITLKSTQNPPEPQIPKIPPEAPSAPNSPSNPPNSPPNPLFPSFSQRGWVLGPSNYYSFGGRQQKAEDPPIPSTELATQVIEYARQLEMIV